MLPNPTHISALKALAAHNTFREAAQSLGMSQASFSRYISAAENDAGHPIFERLRNGVKPTPFGERYLALVDELHAVHQDFDARLLALRADGSDLLRIGCGPLTTRTLITPLITSMLSDIPDIRAKIVVSATESPLQLLRTGDLDLVVCDLTHTPMLEDLDILVMRREPVSFWARADHPIFAKTGLTVGDLLRHPICTANMHRHWRDTAHKALGGDDEARRIVERLPQVECDDYGFLADLTSKTDLLCAARADLFTE
ncbi:MAG: LysR family transcriptional regulator, partial [Mangrovicoccus sp.]